MYDSKNPVIIDNAYVITGPRRRHDKDFIKIFKLFSEKCLEDFGVLNGELKLLIYMMGRLQEEPMNTDGWIDLESDVLITELKTTERTYRLYLNKLKKFGYIEQKRPKSSIWRINPEYVYRGDLVESKRKGKLK